MFSEFKLETPLKFANEYVNSHLFFDGYIKSQYKMGC